jgi:hypothetical protein
MRRLYEAADRVEAQMLMDYLQEQGVSCVLLGDYLSGAAGELPANIFPSLWVIEDRDYPRARRLVREFGRGDIAEEADKPWICPICGEEVDPGFDICWNCASPRLNE